MNVKRKLSVLCFLFLTSIISGCLNLNAMSYGSKAHRAAALGDIESLKHELSKENVNINEKNGYGHTFLHLASSGGHFEVVIFLIENGADIHIKVEGSDVTGGSRISSETYIELTRQVNGATPLHYAAFSTDVEVARYLLSKGADIHARSENENTVLHFAYFAENNQRMTKHLVASGADVTARNADDENAIEAGIRVKALRKKRLDDVHLLEEIERLLDGAWDDTEPAC